MTFLDALTAIVIIVGFFAALAGLVVALDRVLDDWLGR